MRARRSEAGQATTEYLLLLLIVVGAYLLVRATFGRIDLEARFKTRMSDGFTRAYQYGHPKAKGPDEDGGPDMHPRAPKNNDVRIFFVKSSK